jgi:hypothetical protein
MGNNMVDGYKFYNIRKYRGVIMKAESCQEGRLWLRSYFFENSLECLTSQINCSILNGFHITSLSTFTINTTEPGFSRLLTMGTLPSFRANLYEAKICH